MPRIVPNLWFDHTAAEAVDFYTSVFPDSRVLATQHYPTDGLPDFQQSFAGDVLTIDVELGGQRFIAINAGAEFRPNASVSFMLNFDPSTDPQAREHLDALWESLIEGGSALMPLDEYPFSRRYGWVRDRYGITWQLILTDPAGDPRPFVIPSLLFGAEAQNRAAEAIAYYAEVFDGRAGSVVTYPAPTGPATTAAVMFGEVELLGQWFTAMDSGVEQSESFTPAVSLMVECADQAEIDHYWGQLSAVPEAEQCGWCVDKFGLSWQVVPGGMDEAMLRPGNYQKMLEMKKIDLAAFE